ncbi:hypothetical protein [Listeria floridensis]|nr:hypothetical protein [Listeria floridensis]
MFQRGIVDDKNQRYQSPDMTIRLRSDHGKADRYLEVLARA